jgi:hypothetical protein
MPARPLGIVLIVLYSALGAVLFLLVAVLALGSAAMVSRVTSGWMGLLSVAMLGLAVLFCAIAYGLWTRQVWAPRLTLGAYWLSVGLGVIALLWDLTLGNIILQLVGIAICLVIIRYIRKPEIASLFAASDVH